MLEGRKEKKGKEVGGEEGRDRKTKTKHRRKEKIQKNWAFWGSMILPKRIAEVAVASEKLWMSLPVARNAAWQASTHRLEIAFADNNKDP